jgi:hypothetical protein
MMVDRIAESLIQAFRITRSGAHRKKCACFIAATLFPSVASLTLSACADAQLLAVRNSAGVSMAVDEEDSNPALRVAVPDGLRDDAPQWKKVGNALEYASDFGQIHFVARATLRNDGIVFRYEFVNRSAMDYDMVTAITDPRFHTAFYDPRLERTYVHHKGGFDLLPSETPARLSLPLKDWFPVRYLASYAAPVPAERVQHRDDGITYYYYYKSRVVDVPMVATLSADQTWVAASFARDPGDVWSNPELTCQHVDPEALLPHDAHAMYEVKILIFKGSLEDALRKVLAQRETLK